MTALRQPFGFKPMRSLTGSFNPATRRFAINAPNETYIGDPVVLVTGQNVQRMHLKVGVTAGDGAITPVGIVAGLLDANQKPLVFTQPLRGPVLLASAAGFADVYIDPNNTYWVATNISASAGCIGTVVGISAFGSSHANVAVGRSPIGVEITTGVTAVGYLPFKVLGPSPTQRDAILTYDAGDWVDGVEVVMLLNVMNPVSARTGV